MAGLILAAPLLTGTALAQAVDTPHCRQECGATARDRSANTRAVQSCLMRCGAREALARQQRDAERNLGRIRGIDRPAQTGRTAQPVVVPAPDPALRYGAIYTAPPPSIGVGITVGLRDRLLAHRTASNDCMNRSGQPCQMVTEFTFACAAVAHGYRAAPGVAIMTSDPSTFRIIAAGHGMANTQADAEYDAISHCSRRDRGLTCRVVRSLCAGGH